jgi:hypothetical protein
MTGSSLRSNPLARLICRHALEDLCDDYGQVVFLLFGSREGGDGVGDVRGEGGAGVVLVAENELLEAVEGELRFGFVLLLGDAVSEEGEDVAGFEGDDGVGELDFGEDADDGAGVVELEDLVGAGTDE